MLGLRVQRKWRRFSNALEADFPREIPVRAASLWAY
jgi:hypothetical protein